MQQYDYMIAYEEDGKIRTCLVSKKSLSFALNLYKDLPCGYWDLEWWQHVRAGVLDGRIKLQTVEERKR